MNFLFGKLEVNKDLSKEERGKNMNPCNEEISLGKLIYLLLGTNRFNSAKCTIYDDSKSLYVEKVVYIKDYVASGRLDKLSNLQYLYDRKVKNFYIKGLLKNQIEIIVSCENT